METSNMSRVGFGVGGQFNAAHPAVPELVGVGEYSESDFLELARMEESYYKEVDTSESYDEIEFRDDVRKALQDPSQMIFVARVGSLIAGFIWLEEMALGSDTIGYISNIHVAKKYRQLGIAANLLNRAEEYFKKRRIKSIQLEVVQNNTPAIRLYLKTGFVPIGEYMVKSLT